jgi:hypothetical protein
MCAEKPALEADPAAGRKPDSNLAAAYQVTARLLAAEQQGIWSRTQSFIGIHAAIAAAITLVLGKDVKSGALPWYLPASFASVGIALSVLAFFSFCRSWQFRDLFASIMRAQEKELLGPDIRLSPLRLGDRARSKKGAKVDWASKPIRIRGLGQKPMSYVVTIIFLVLYGVLFVVALPRR